MYRAISSEFLKLRRSKLLILAAVAGILPSIIKFLQLSFSKEDSKNTWELFLTTGKEIQVLGILITVILLSGFIFNMEYQYKTVSYILTSGVSKIQIYFSKMLSLLTVIALLLLISELSELLFGFVLINSAISGALLIKLVKVTLWYIVSYFLLSAVVIMLSVLTKKFVITSVITLGVFMMTFPFHLKDSIYICPFMTPAAVATKIYDSNYLLDHAYKNMNVNSYSVLVFLMVLGLISTIIGVLRYRSSDAVS